MLIKWLGLLIGNLTELQGGAKVGFQLYAKQFTLALLFTHYEQLWAYFYATLYMLNFGFYS